MTDQISRSGIVEPRSAFVKRLLAIVVVTNLFIIGLAGFSLQQARLRYEERAEITTQNLSHALAGQIADAVDKIDLTVLTVADEVEKQLAAGGIDAQRLNAFIVRHHARLPVLDGLRVVNAQGENAYGIGITPGTRTSVADRAYFERLRSDPNAGVVISEPVVGRVSKKWSIILARRVNQPDGSFAGLVYGTIALEHFLTTFSSLDVGKHGSIALCDEELALITRYPELRGSGNVVGTKIASPEMQKAVQAQKDAGSYRTARAFDNIPRTYSYHKVSNRPLYVNVGLAYEDYLGAWGIEAARVSALVALFILCTLISSWLGYRGWIRRANAVNALAQQEEAMRESEVRYKSIIENIRMLSDRSLAGVYVVQDGIFKYLNANAAFYAGYSSEELVGRESSALLHPEDREIARQNAGEMLRGVRQTPYEYRIINKAGEIRWILETVTTIPYEGKSAVLGNSMDISQLKEADKALREGEERFNKAFRSSPALEAITALDDGRIVDVNDKWLAVLGYTREEVIGRRITDIGVWTDPGARGNLIRQLRENNSVRDTHVRARTKSGEVRDIYMSGEIIRAGNDDFFLSLGRDVTDTMKTENALRESETRFRQLIEEAPDGIYVQTEGRIAYVNNTLLRMFGARSEEELLGRHFMEHIHPDYRDQVRERARIVNEEKRAVTAQDQVYLKLDGTPIDVEVSVVPLRYGGRDGALVFIRDISERKKAEKALHESETLFRSVLEMLPVGVFLINQSGQIDMLNPAGQEIWNGNRHVGIECYGEYRAWWADTGQRVTPEQWNAARAIQNGETSINEEIEIESFDGIRKFILCSALPIWDSTGRIKGAIAVNVDITARKRAEKALREQTLFLQTLIDSIPAPVFFKDREGRYIGCNNEFAKLRGLSQETIVGKTIFDLAPRPRAEVNQAMDEKLFLERSNQVYEQRVQYADGILHDVIFNKAPFTDEAGNIKGLVGIMLDVTGQKVMEKSLREREKQMRALLDNIPDIVWLKDSESRYIAANEPFGKMCGLKPEELVGKTDLDLWPKDLAETYRVDDWDVIQSGRSKRVEEFLEDATGKRIWIETFKTPIRDDQGVVMGTTGIARDITERKRVEDLYRMLSDRSLAGVYVVQDGIFKYLNANAALCAGYSPEDLVGRESSALLHPEDREIARQNAGEMLRGIRQTPYEYRIINKTGGIRWILETVTTIPYEGKSAVLGNSMDITQFKEAQQKLDELQALESSVLAAIPHAVIGFENRRVIFANDNVEAVFGWKPAEIIGKHPAVFFSSKSECDVLIRQITQALQTLTVYSAEPEHPLVHRDGRPLHCRVTAARIGGGASKGLVATVEDVTERKRDQLHLLQSEKMASIGQLAAGVAHEINNPTGYVSSNLKTMAEYFDDVMGILQRYHQFLNGVRDFVEKAKLDGNLSMLMKEIDDMEKKIDIDYILKDAPSLIHESREGMERIKEIVLSLKNFAHPGEDRFIYSDVNKNMDSTLNVVWNELKYKTTIRKEYGELPEVECYPQQINQVFVNMLVNAAQAIKVKGEIAIQTRSLGDVVEISISDTGVGIPEENLARIFDPFFTTKEVGKGTGLGLNVAYNIIKKHKGAIDVKSKIGEGTTFTIRLPVHQAQGQPMMPAIEGA